MNFIFKKTKVQAVRDMNVRVGEPTLSAKVISISKGTVFSVDGYVTDGALVTGNSKWYKNSDGNYLWDGNVQETACVPEKILHTPIANLICTQKFGERPQVYKNYGSPKGHNGLDFRTWVNGDSSKWKQSVFAVMDGVVSEAGSDPIFKGNYVRIVHANAHESVYLHLSKLSAKKRAEGIGRGRNRYKWKFGGSK